MILTKINQDVYVSIFNVSIEVFPDLHKSYLL